MASYGVQLKDKNGNKVYPSPYWPIGSIYLSVTNVNPGTIFGGTWERFAYGRCLVGVDENQTEFNTVLKSGGSKYLQNHTHTQNGHDHWVGDNRPTGFVNAIGWYGSGGGAVLPFHGGTGASNSDLGTYGMRTDIRTPSINSTGNGDSQNLQPYLTVYIWRRIA